MYEMDRAIVEALFQKDLHYNDLYDTVNKPCDRKVSESVFRSALIRLRKEGIIIREVETEGRPRTKYKLFEKARQEYQFGVLKFGPTNKIKPTRQKRTATSDPILEEITQEQMYHLLFFFGTTHHPVYNLSTKKGLQEFLSSIGISSDELHIIDSLPRAVVSAAGAWPYTLYVRIDEKVSALPASKITPPYSIFITRYEPPIPGLTIWKEQYRYVEYGNEETVRPEIEKLRSRLKDELKGVKARNITIELHRYTTPGVAVSDLLNGERLVFQHIDLSKEGVNRAFELLKEKGLIKLAFVFQGEERYDIADENLAKVIASCWEVFNTVAEALTLTWLYVRRSRDTERKWLSTFYGSRISDDLFRKFFNYRKNWPQDNEEKIFRQSVEEEVRNLIRKAIDTIEEIKTIHSVTIEKYHFPLDSFINLIFPPCFPEQEKEEDIKGYVKRERTKRN